MKRNFFYLVCFLLIGSAALASSSVEESEKSKIRRIERTSFDKKDKDFWVLKSKEAFNAADVLIDEDGAWKGEDKPPQYFQFVEKLTSDDLPTLERWLSLKGLICFGIADEKNQPNLRLILSYYNRLKADEDDTASLNKLGWLNAKTMNDELQLSASSSPISPEMIETNRDFQMKDSHYRVIGAH